MSHEKEIKEHDFKITYILTDDRGHATGNQLVKIIKSSTESKSMNKLKAELLMSNEIKKFEDVNVISCYPIN